MTRAEGMAILALAVELRELHVSLEYISRLEPHLIEPGFFQEALTAAASDLDVLSRNARRIVVDF
jgi:hypothetical protein